MPRGRKNITQADEEIIRRAQQADAPQPRRRSGRGAAGTAAVRRRRPFWLRAVRFASIALSILAVLVLIATAYAGYVSPLQRYGGYWGILPLGFPIVFWACILLAAVQLFYCRKGSLIIAAGILVSIGPVLNYTPLHFTSPKAPAGSDTISVLTYNLCNLVDQRQHPDTTQSTILNYVIGRNADIVCLQEATYFTPRGGFYKTYVQPWQVDTLHAMYPYIHHDGNEEMILSKFPVEPIHLDVSKDKFHSGNVAAYRLTLPDNRKLTVFSVHLQSLGLSPDDRELYHNLTELHHEDFGSVRAQLISKLSYANVQRARQAHFLLRYIRLYGGPDVLVCGDFNDVPGCFAIRSLEDAGFRSVYPEIGFGPMVTYNQNRFLFCIDHILYRGDLVPLEIRKGRLKASDHYPVMARFAVPGRDSSPGPLD